jgi:hypothetical protein
VYDDDLRERQTDLDEPGLDGDEPLVCRSCGASITDRELAFSPDGQPPERVFFNPAGLVMRVLTVRGAGNLALVGDRVAEFTWFPGFTWRVAVCAACATHLGWLYETVEGAEPALFWGFLLERLAEG